MTTTFDSLPASLREPGFYFETHSAGSRVDDRPSILLIGDGTAVAADDNTLTRVGSAGEVADYAGQGSMLHRMAYGLYDAMPAGAADVYVLQHATIATSTKAQGALAFTGPATASGRVYIRALGVTIPVAVSSGDSADDIGVLAAAALNLDANWPWGVAPLTAANSAGEVTLTADEYGALPNNWDLAYNPEGPSGGQRGVAGVGCSVERFGVTTEGAGDPSLADTIAAMGDRKFTWVITPYSSDTLLSLVTDEVSRRWGPLVAAYGRVVTAYAGTTSDIATHGAGRDSEHEMIIAIEGDATPGTATYRHPEPVEVVPCRVVGSIVGSLYSAPYRSTAGIEIRGMAVPGVTDRFTTTERITISGTDRMATYYVDDSGVARCSLLRMSYATDDLGVADDVFLPLQTGYLVERYLEDAAQFLAQRLTGFGLVSDATVIDGGASVVNPKGIKRLLISHYSGMVSQYWMQDLARFVASSVFAQDPVNQNRVNASLAITPTNQLDIVACRADVYGSPSA